MAVKNEGDIVFPACMGLLTLRLFGGFEGRLSTGLPLTLPTRKARALLAYLALRPGQPHPRDTVAALLWGDKEAEQARHSLRQAISSIRKTLSHASPRCLFLEGDAITLAPAAVEVDAVLFERLVNDGSPPALERATTLYSGHFLEGLDVKEEMFEEWLMTERERLRELALEALARLLSHQLKNDLDEAAIQTGLRLLGLDPLQEAVHQILMRLYFKSGRRGAALIQYQRCVEVLQRELGVEPEPETKQLYQDILRRASSAAPAEMPQIHKAGRRRRKSTATRFQFRAPESSLIGREAELSQLRQAVKEARKGRGQTIAILGEAGIGKSRLVEEICAEAIRGGDLALVGRAFEIEQVLPFGPWTNALRGDKVIEDPRIVQSLDPIWRVELARLFPELGVPGLELATDPQNAVRLFESVAHLLDCLASRQPVLLVLEDLHWADEMSLRLFSFLSHRIQHRSVLLVGTAREEEVAETPILSQLLQELDRGRGAVSLTLSPLSLEEAGTLVRRLAQARVGESALTRLEEGVWARSQGNPFIIVETMRALQDGDSFEVESTVPLPKQVRLVVAQRLERLSDRAKRLVAVAAVVGREFDFAVLERASGLGEAETAEGVEELVRRRVLHGVEEHFDFTHDRIREVAYAQILPPRRKLLHGLVAKALEEVYAENLEPHYAALGIHYRAGEVWNKAVAYLRQAGQKAGTHSANREAVMYFEQALEALGHLPKNRETLELAVDLRLDLQPPLNTLREVGRIVEYLSQADSISEALGDKRRRGSIAAGLTAYYATVGMNTRALEAGERALAIATELSDVSLQVVAQHRLSRAYCWVGNYRRAIELATRSLPLIEGRPMGERFGNLTGVASAVTRVPLIVSLAELGEFAEGVAQGEEAVRIAEMVGQPFSLIAALSRLSHVYVVKGEPNKAIPLLVRSLDICTNAQAPFHLSLVRAELGYCYLLTSRVDEALPLLEHSVNESAPGTRDQLHRCWLSEAYLFTSQWDRGIEVAQHALDLSRNNKERGNEAYALRLLGEVAAQKDFPDPRAAEDDYRQALTLAEELGMRPLIARCHVGLGRLYRCEGERKKAEEHLTTGVSMMREMEMGLWLERAEAALKELG